MRRARLITLACVFSALVAIPVAIGAAPVVLAPSTDHTEICGGSSSAGNDRYLVLNNVWGADTTQCLDVAEDTGAFRIASSDHDNGASVAAYPMVFTGCHWGRCTRDSDLPVRVDRIESLTSDWSFRGGGTGTWNATYDLWFHTTPDVNRSPDGAELMIWLDHGGGANPGATPIARGVPLAGATWDVWHARWAWNHVAYVRTSPTASVDDLDLAAFIRDATTRGYVDRAWHLTAVEAGFELWRGGTGLESTEFSVALTQG
jgi:hypothetical protein